MVACMHACMQTKHTCMHANKHALHANKHASVRANMHACMFARIRLECVRMRMCTAQARLFFIRGQEVTACVFVC